MEDPAQSQYEGPAPFRILLGARHEKSARPAVLEEKLPKGLLHGIGFEDVLKVEGQHS